MSDAKEGIQQVHREAIAELSQDPGRPLLFSHMP